MTCCLVKEVSIDSTLEVKCCLPWHIVPIMEQQQTLYCYTYSTLFHLTKTLSFSVNCMTQAGKKGAVTCNKCPEPSQNIKDVIKRLHYDREMVVTPSFLYDFSRMFHFGYYMGGKSAFISLRTTEKQKHNVTKGTVNVISIQCGHTGGMFYITAALKIFRLFWISPKCLPNNK